MRTARKKMNSFKKERNVCGRFFSETGRADAGKSCPVLEKVKKVPKRSRTQDPRKSPPSCFFSLNFYISTFFRCSLLLLRALFLVGAFFSENENQWVRAPVTGRFSLLVAPHVLPHESRPRSAIYLFLARFPRNCSALIPSKMAIHFACAKKTVPHAMYSHWPWIRPKIALSWEKKDV